MVEPRAEQLDAVFRALGDGTRRAMLLSLGSGERTVSELAAPFAMSLAGASKHVRVLEAAGLVSRTVRGRTHICRLRPDALTRAQAWLTYYRRFWTDCLEPVGAPPRERN